MFRRRKLSAPVLPSVGVTVRDYEEKELYSLELPPLFRDDRPKYLAYVASAFIRTLLMIGITISLVVFDRQESPNTSSFPPKLAALFAIGVLFVGFCGEVAILVTCPKTLDPVGIFPSNYSTFHRIYVFLGRFFQLVGTTAIIFLAVPPVQVASQCSREQNLDNDCHRVWYMTNNALFGMAGFACLIPWATASLWQSPIWTVIGSLATMRLITAVITCSLTLRFVGRTIEYVKGTDQGEDENCAKLSLEFNQVSSELRGQILLLFILLIVNGFFAGVASMAGSIFSHITVWRRSQYFIIYDVVCLSLQVIWLILCSISYGWMRQILKYLCIQKEAIAQNICTIIVRSFRMSQLYWTMWAVAGATGIQLTLYLLILFWESTEAKKHYHHCRNIASRMATSFKLD